MPSTMGKKRVLSKTVPKETASPEPKRTRMDLQMAAVVEAIELAGGLPAECRAMLIAVMPNCFATPAAERHEHQATLVSWIGEVVDGVKEQLQSAVETAKAQASQEEATKDGLRGKVTEAKAALNELESAAADLDAKAAKASDAVDAARAYLADAREAQNRGVVETAELGEEKDALVAAVAVDLQAIKQTRNFEAAQVGQHVAVLMPIASRLGLEESLILAMPAAFMRHPSERGPFDRMVLDQLEREIGQKVAHLQSKLQARQTFTEERSAALAAAKQELREAEEAERAALSHVELERDRQKQASEILREAEIAVAAFESVRAAAAEACKEKEAAFENFTGFHMECFNALRDRAVTAGASYVREERRPSS